MKTLIGLGNPGKEYEGTRHNVGRETAARIAKHFEFESFEEKSKYCGFFAKGVIGEEKSAILLPNTFMNKSGKALLELSIKPKSIIVIHDDSDILLGYFKISFGKNSGGHRGVESVMRALKTKGFWRIRIGIQKKKRIDAMDLVLKKFNPEEQKIIAKVEKAVISILEKSDLQATRGSVI